MKNLKFFVVLLATCSFFAFYPYKAGYKNVPSNLADFTVYSNKDHVKVTWTTHSRHKALSFVIQRSRDGKKFAKLKVISDEGNDPKTMEFFEVDNTPLPGWSYYRVAEVLASGDSAYSGVAPVFFGIDRIKRGEFIAAANPLDMVNRGNLEDFHGEQVLMVVRDAKGTEYYINQTLKVKGGRLSIQAGKEVPQGIYVITASSKDLLVGLEIFADL